MSAAGGWPSPEAIARAQAEGDGAVLALIAGGVTDVTGERAGSVAVSFDARNPQRVTCSALHD